MKGTNSRARLAKALAVIGLIVAVDLFGSGIAAAATIDISCTPVQVAVFTNAPRLHVRCAASVGGINFFALSTANAPLAARVLSILTTAQVAGRTLGIRYDPADTSGTSIGCQANDCRLIVEAWFGQ
jgi:hypothetical protein